jgi:beta-lysine 5,6-aminomutase beta subunit
MTTCATTQVDLTKVKPYGDALNDGKVQLAFTLPVPYGEEAEECAKQYAKKLGLEEPNVAYYCELTNGIHSSTYTVPLLLQSTTLRS